MGKEPVRLFEGNAKPHEAFWKFRNAEDGQEPEMELYGYISEYSWFEDDVTPKMFKDDLQKYGKGGPITVRIHSGGGDVWAASVMRSAMIDYPGKITVKVDGLCASAAMIVAMAGKRVLMQETAYMMIHDPSTILWGNIEEFKKALESLKVCKDGILDSYETKTGLPKEKLSKMMTDETWMTAREAVTLGFADEVITINAQQKVTNSTGKLPVLVNALTPDLRKTFVNIPKELQPAPLDIKPANQPEPTPTQEEMEQKHAANQLRAEVLTYL